MVLPNPFQTPTIRRIPSFGDYQAQQQQVGAASGFAPKTDTGAGWSYTAAPASSMSFDPANPTKLPGSSVPGPGPLYDNNGVASHTPPAAAGGAAATATPATGNPFGYDYSGVAPGYNAWALYNGGSNDGGWYNAATDTARWDAGRGNGQQENSRDRVWRWTLDDLRAANGGQYAVNPGGAPTELVNQLFLKNVARLHRDFDANHMNWQQSGFQNFDRAGGASQQGGVTGPAYSSGPPPPGAPGSNAQMGPPPVPNNPAGGAGTAPPVPGAGGAQGGNGLSNSQANFLIDDPNGMNSALRYVMQGMGVNPDSHGLVASYLMSKYSDPIKALVNIAGLQGNGSGVENIQGLLDQMRAGITGKAGSLGSTLRPLVDQTYSTIMNDPNMDDSQKLAMLSNLGLLGTMGQNPLIIGSKVNELKALMGQYNDQEMNSLGSNYQLPSARDFLASRNFRPY